LGTSEKRHRKVEENYIFRQAEFESNARAKLRKQSEKSDPIQIERQPHA
jgi:hypothetical protein